MTKTSSTETNANHLLQLLNRTHFRLSVVAESSATAGRGCWKRMRMSCSAMPLDPPHIFSSSFLPLILLLFLEVGLCGKEDYHIFNKLWVPNNFEFHFFGNIISILKKICRLPLEAEYAHFSPSLREEMLAETRRMFQVSFWGRGVFFFKAISQKWVINENYFFQHGYDNYMQHAWPLDELNPLACCGRGGWHLIPHTSAPHLIWPCKLQVQTLKTLTIST